jgi:hypothetical protein
MSPAATDGSRRIRPINEVPKTSLDAWCIRCQQRLLGSAPCLACLRDLNSIRHKPERPTGSTLQSVSVCIVASLQSCEATMRLCGSRLVVAVLLAVCSTRACLAQFGMPNTPEAKPLAVKSDLPYIRCQTCEAIIKQAIKNVKEMREKLSGKQKAGTCTATEALPGPLQLLMIDRCMRSWMSLKSWSSWRPCVITRSRSANGSRATTWWRRAALSSWWTWAGCATAAVAPAPAPAAPGW